MSKAKRPSSTRPGPEGRKPYRTPRLAVHGDIRTLTGTKKGTKSDGASKPVTRASGTNS